uniref:Translation elongation factor EF1B beta/delta subunit guanine nucleotide exchange domain-containing protein n=1 Tax=Chelydra serpentina TaxID=8475 RepID=A0A8C3SM61_CHESE
SAFIPFHIIFVLNPQTFHPFQRKTVLDSPQEAPPAQPKRKSGRPTSASTTSSAGPGGDQNELIARIANLEVENQNLHSVVADLQLAISKLETRLNTLEKSSTSHHPSATPPTQWDDETDMAMMEECVRSIQMDGLVWGASKLVPVGYGIKKLQIQCVVEDDKVGTDILEEEITKFEDYVSPPLVPRGAFKRLGP